MADDLRERLAEAKECLRIVKEEWLDQPVCEPDCEAIRPTRGLEEHIAKLEAEVFNAKSEKLGCPIRMRAALAAHSKPAQEALCGTAESAPTSMNKATRPIAKTALPSEELLSQPHRTLRSRSEFDTEAEWILYLDSVLNAPEPNVTVNRDGTCQPAARSTVIGASPVCLDCNRAGIRNCSHFDNCDGTWVYKPEAQRAEGPGLREIVCGDTRDWATDGPALERLVAALREALGVIRHIPVKPFPDAGAHSWRAFGEAVFGAWSDIQRVAEAALRTDAPSQAGETKP
jgi:hypothetical protein